MGIRLEGRGFSGKIDRKNVPVPKKEGMALFREQRFFFSELGLIHAWQEFPLVYAELTLKDSFL